MSKKNYLKLSNKVLGVFAVIMLLVSFAFSALAVSARTSFAQESEPESSLFTILNPYEDVVWGTWGSYRAALHSHTHYSDGSNSRWDTVQRHYNLDFDILAITDHDYVTVAWDECNGTAQGGRAAPTSGPLTSAQRTAIINGTHPSSTRTRQNGMIEIPFTNEPSRGHHINTFFSNVPQNLNTNESNTLRLASEANGFAILNHPGRHTRSPDGIAGQAGGAGGAAASNNPAEIARYVNWFNRYPGAIGIEIINRLDHETRSDRILWDNILAQTMPHRPVWGFSTDDSHGVNGVGFSYTMMLMDELTVENTRTAMETGAFYAVTRVARREGIRPDAPNSGGSAQFAWHNLVMPSPTNIVVDENAYTITITGANTTAIEWIANGVHIHTGNILDLTEHKAGVVNYVRAQLRNADGMAFLQPFGIIYTGPTDFAVTNQTEFMTAARIISGRTGTIEIAESFNLVGGTDNTAQDAFITLGRDTDLTIFGSPLNNFENSTITVSNRAIFVLNNDAQLTFDGIRINGDRSWYATFDSSIHARYDYFILANDTSVLNIFNSVIDMGDDLASNTDNIRLICARHNSNVNVTDSSVHFKRIPFYSPNNNGTFAWILRGTNTISTTHGDNTAGGTNNRTFHRGTLVLYGNQTIGATNQLRENIIDFRDTTITGTVPTGTAAAVLAKTGTGTAVTNDAFQIYFSMGIGSDPIANGIRYTTPIVLLSNNRVIRAVIRNGRFFSEVQEFTLSPDAPAVVDSIEVAMPPNRIAYNPGDTLDLSGLTLIAHTGSQQTVLESGEFVLVTASIIPQAQAEGFMTVTVAFAGDTMITADFMVVIYTETTTQITITNQQELQLAASFFDGRTGTIVLANSFNWVGATNNQDPVGQLVVSGNTNLTIRGSGNNTDGFANSTITVSNRVIFELRGNATLTLDGIRIDGDRAYYAPFFDASSGIGGHARYDYLFAASDNATLELVDSHIIINGGSARGSGADRAHADLVLARFIDNTTFIATDSIVDYNRITLYSTANSFNNTWILRGDTVVMSPAGSAHYRGTFLLFDNAILRGTVNNSTIMVALFDNSQYTNFAGDAAGPTGSIVTRLDFTTVAITQSFNDGIVTLTRTGGSVAGTAAGSFNLRFTTDGSDPATSSTAMTYTAPFAITAAITVRATLIHSTGMAWNLTADFTDVGEAYFQAVEDLISLIDTISDNVLESQSIISQAREDFNAMDTNQRLLVTNSYALFAAEIELTTMLAVARLQVLNVISGINSLPDVGDITLAHGRTIDALYNAYLVLSAAQRADVTNYSVLQAAAARLEEIRSAATAGQSVWFTGTTAPSNTLGNNGDFFMNIADSTMYVKVLGEWVEINIQGDTGEQGNAGANGATWHTGAASPANTLGNDGDMFFDTTTNRVYLRTGGVWTEVANLTGAPGQDGVDGQDGKDGQDGATGPQGPASQGETNGGGGCGAMTFGTGGGIAGLMVLLTALFIIAFIVFKRKKATA